MYHFVSPEKKEKTKSKIKTQNQSCELERYLTTFALEISTFDFDACHWFCLNHNYMNLLRIMIFLCIWDATFLRVGLDKN